MTGLKKDNLGDCQGKKRGRKKGCRAWNRGLTKSDIRVKKYVDKHIGKSGMIGKRHSEVTKLSMSISAMGNKNGVGNRSNTGKPAWNKGLPKEKHPQYGKKRSIETKLKIGKKNKGKIRSEETKQRLRDIRLKQVFPLKDTSIEIKVQNQLKEKDYSFETHKALIGQPDIYLYKINLCIFIDGCYWHSCPIHFPKRVQKRIEKDLKINKKLRELGYSVIRIWEHDIEKKDFNIENYLIDMRII